MKPLIGLLLLLVLSCKKDLVMPDESLNTIIGQWNWVSSSGGFIGATKTPKSEGVEIKLEFNKDGSFRFFENGKRKQKGTYSFIRRKTNVLADTAFLIIMTYHSLNKEPVPGLPQAISFIDEQTLFLQEECSDCFSHVYKRAE